jgi:hypothetical protein
MVVRMREKGLKATGCNSAIGSINAYPKRARFFALVRSVPIWDGGRTDVAPGYPASTTTAPGLCISYTPGPTRSF